ncbi:MAG: hypothetical protein ACKOFW_10170, partial [Planctomycetaceae bacterium]
LSLLSSLFAKRTGIHPTVVAPHFFPDRMDFEEMQRNPIVRATDSLTLQRSAPSVAPAGDGHRFGNFVSVESSSR